VRLLLALLLVLALHVSAQARWLVSSGLRGHVESMVATSRVALAGTLGHGLYRSFDQGVTWTPLGFAGDYVSALAGRGLTLYAAVQRCSVQGICRKLGVYYSSDGGNSWAPAGLAGHYITALAVAPGPRAKVYAATLSGLWVATSGAWDWGRRFAAQALDVAVRRGAPSWVMVGTTRGLWLSSDGGRSWRVLALGNGYLPAVAFGPGSLLLAGSSSCDNAGCTGQIFRSADGGSSWVAENVQAGIDRLQVDPWDPSRVVAGSYVNGLFISYNGAQSWINTSPDPYNYDVTGASFTPQHLLVGLFGDPAYWEVP
jgi:photosystem II stability/assembly factor-like uncharacterized protein